MRIQFSEPITLSPDEATEIFRVLEKLRVDASDQLAMLAAIEELKKIREAGNTPLSPERLAELKQRSSEIPLKVHARIQAAVQQVYEVFRETRLRGFRKTPACKPEVLASRIDSEIIKWVGRTLRRLGFRICVTGVIDPPKLLKVLWKYEIYLG